ncbi:alpha/beta fold hydrolase [Gordonia insulae]|uniref:3-oxoadipate enol-lactonase 2 n=1 Tax=Gordonia insulae TaxID=2420509 RepID=A0A3G8JQJ9_9ACTN|nr:alpha/beta fold hydrolase [Gordonia insulae]AZG46995.1 3-oxoadipate enol-lactonase 2 [Gordonia insulae]
MSAGKAASLHIHRVIAGAGERVLVLLHGLGGDVDFWSEVMSPFGEHLRVIAIDLRGSGGTSATPGGHDIDDLADDVCAVLDAEGVSRASIVGFSMGGLVAQSLAARHPGRLDRLVLASTYLTIGARARLFLDGIETLVRDGATDRRIFELVGPWLFSSEYLSEPRNLAALEFPDGVEEQAGEAWLYQYAANRAFDGRSLETITAPTLVLGGADDALVPTADMRDLADAIPGARLVVLPDAGHLVNVEAPDTLVREILDFVSIPGPDLEGGASYSDS